MKELVKEYSLQITVGTAAILIGGVFWLSGVAYAGAENTKDITELKEVNIVTALNIEEIKETLWRLDEKVDILLK